jgi:hypothetical protein
MPKEVLYLQNLPSPIRACPKCGAQPFEPFLRGTVQRSPTKVLWSFRWPFISLVSQPYCALICWKCKEIVGYE